MFKWYSYSQNQIYPWQMLDCSPPGNTNITWSKIAICIFLKPVIILADIMHNAISRLVPIKIQQQFSDTNFKLLFLRSLQSSLQFCKRCVISLCLQILGEAEIQISLILSATGVLFLGSGKCWPCHNLVTVKSFKSKIKWILLCQVCTLKQMTHDLKILETSNPSKTTDRNLALKGKKFNCFAGISQAIFSLFNYTFQVPLYLLFPTWVYQLYLEQKWMNLGLVLKKSSQTYSEDSIYTGTPRSSCCLCELLWQPSLHTIPHQWHQLVTSQQRSIASSTSSAGQASAGSALRTNITWPEISFQTKV